MSVALVPPTILFSAARKSVLHSSKVWSEDFTWCTGIYRAIGLFSHENNVNPSKKHILSGLEPKGAAAFFLAPFDLSPWVAWYFGRNFFLVEHAKKMIIAKRFS